MFQGAIIDHMRLHPCASVSLLRACLCLSSIHDRMPVVLSPERARKWLDHTTRFEELLPFLSPYKENGKCVNLDPLSY